MLYIFAVIGFITVLNYVCEHGWEWGKKIQSYSIDSTKKEVKETPKTETKKVDKV